MKTQKNDSLKALSQNELVEISGGSFAYDVGAALGWLYRATGPLGVGYANAVWACQYGKL